MNLYAFLPILTFLLSIVSCKQVESNLDIETFNSVLGNSFDYLPTSTSNNVYKHKGYSFSYMEKYEQSEWVAYYLEESDFSSGKYTRPFFNQDPLVETKSADWRNYKKTKYNKGHLCPAGDRKKSYALYKETFYTSNASPQLYDFNAGIWNRFEQKTRYWASKYNGVYVVTGGVLTKGLKTIGKEKVAVPDYFYKILLSKDGSRMIGFLVPHKDSDAPLSTFSVSVDTIEEVTGIDFFPALDDVLENKLEVNSNYKNWFF
uniref:DNA/RNA non-specific endonuclease n=1 Tax=Flavobacterium sp. TaxID=239 RepID=UPI0040494557